MSNSYVSTKLKMECLLIYLFNKRLYNVYSIFAFSLLFHTLTIFQGVDVTDLGFHLTNQVYSTRIPVDIASIWPVVFFTDFVGGIWLSLAGEPSLLWARFGGVLAFSLSAAIIFSILSDYFDRKRVFFVVLASSLFVTMRFGICIIDYFTFPALLMNIELWIFNKTLRSAAFTKGFSIYSFMLGFMLIPIVLSRVSLILIFIVPFVIFLYCFPAKKDLYIQISRTAILGLCTSILLFVLLYWHIGLLENYGSSLLAMAGESASGADRFHSIRSLIISYLRDCIIIIGSNGALLIGFYAISAIGRRFGKRVAEGLVILGALLSIFFMILSRRDIDYFAFFILKAAIGLIILLSGMSLFFDRDNDCKNALLLAGITIMMITPIGSNGGLLKSFYGMWLILPLSILCAYDIQDRISKIEISSILSLLKSLLIALLILSVFFHITDIYRDDQNRINLNTEFSSHSLRGIYSTNDRVRVLDDLLSQIEKNTNEGDEILLVSAIPLVYYLTETRPTLGYPWPEQIPLDKVKEKVQIWEDAKKYPKMFVYTKVDTENRNWPDANDIDRGDSEVTEYLKNQYLNRQNYSLLSENEAFAIYLIKNRSSPTHLFYH